MKTAASNKKIREIINLVRDGKIIPRPEFQRRLVWTRNDKNNFIDTILRGYPFPEIYLADGDINLETGDGTQLLVDGLQRVTTISQYFYGDPELKLTTVLPYNELHEDEQKKFLLYDIAVRDLGSVLKEEIIEVFKRLNATKYSLTDIEVSNAVYSGTLKKFAESIASNPFFTDHNVFNAADYKRMGDLRYALSIICTMIAGYFNRDEEFEFLLDRYNDDFPLESDIRNRFEQTVQFINECGFESNSRVWRKADLFTFIIEIDNALYNNKMNLQPSEVVENIQGFFAGIDGRLTESTQAHNIYYKAALQATNDKSSRVRRGLIIGELLEGKSPETIAIHVQ